MGDSTGSYCETSMLQKKVLLKEMSLKQRLGE